MIIRRLVVTLVLVLFASLTIGVILGLDSAARSAVVERLTGTPAPAASEPAATTPVMPAPSSSPPAASTPAAPTGSTAAGQAEPTAAPKSEPTARAKATTTPKAKPTTASPKPKPSATSPSAKAKASSKKTTRKGGAAKIYLTGPLKNGAGGTVHITFDDGPGPATQTILDTLSRTGSTATFFQLGVNVPSYPHAKARIKSQGSNIGNHTYNHPNLTKLSAKQVRWQLANGPDARCFRPPYGATGPAVRRAIADAGMRQVLWDVDTLDWSKPGVTTLAKVGRLRSIRDGSVILMHDGGGDRSETVAALPKMIADLQARGFKVRALPYC